MMYTQLCSWDNLLLAYRQAAKGKRGHPNVAAFEYHLEDNLLALQRELREQTYQPGAYTSFYIHEPKRRLISAAPFRDRVVHHALCNVIEPLFERSFIFDSYANRKGKGTHRALNRCQQFARRYRYVLQCDIRQFFPSIDHAILRDTLARKIDDAQTLWLVDQILASGVGVLSEEYTMVWFPGDDLWAVHRPRGLPIGNLTSQFWANCYLTPFDHFIQRELQCPAYLRYVDDFLLFADDKRLLWEFKRALIERLARFRLTIHHEQAQVHPADDAIPFLGFLIFPERRRLKPRMGWRFTRRLRALARQYADDTITLEEITASIQGWVNHTRYANTIGLRQAILASEITIAKRTPISNHPISNLQSPTHEVPMPDHTQLSDQSIPERAVKKADAFKEPPAPQRAMAISAHPDDQEFTIGGTLAKWARAGCDIVTVCITSGDAGSNERTDPNLAKEKLAQIREAEQRAACRVLGVQHVEFLHYPDGILQPTLELRRDLTRLIRKYKPEIVLCGDPTVRFYGNSYLNHPDHRAAADAALDAVFPSAGTRFIFPELLAEGLEPHAVSKIFIHGSEKSDAYVDIGATMETKIAALKEHKSQLGDWDPSEMLREWAREGATEHGLEYAEAFRVMILKEDEPKTAEG